MSDPTRRAPLVVVLVVALVPAIGLAGLWRWASAVDAEPVDTVPATFEPAAPPTPELSTDLASLRRTPGPIGDRLVAAAQAEAESSFRSAVDSVVVDAASVGESCATVTLDGEPVASAGDDRSVIPASNQKLFVAAAALEVIGEDTELVTVVRSSIPVDGVVTGDLFLVGGGDPLLRSAEVPIERPLAVATPTSFDQLVDAIVEAGVTRIDGDLVADGSRYDDEFIVPGWGPDITRDDGGPIGALLVNDGRIVGSGVGLNPGQSAVNELRRLLVGRGIPVTGGNRTVSSEDAPDELPVLAEVRSVPVGDLVAEMLVTSDNQIAEMMVKEIGYVGAGSGTRPAGLSVTWDLLAERGVRLEGATFDDGSGLSRGNAVRCTTVVEMLATESIDGPLGERLAVLGETGTLAEIGLDTEGAGQVRAKTGTLTGVKALSGFLPVAGGDGSAFEFSILLEGDGVSDPALHLPVWEALWDVLASYPPEVPDLDVESLGPR